MANANASAGSANTSSGSKKRIEVTPLDPGLRATYSAAPDSVVAFDFDVDEVAFSREGNAMLVHQDNGAVITLQGMFGDLQSNFPDFELKGGLVISGQDFMSTLSPRLDIAESPRAEGLIQTGAIPPASLESEFEPAAGPESKPSSPERAEGSGVGEFRGLGGGLVESVDRFGFGDGLFDWDNSTLGVEPQDTVRGAVDISIRDPFGGGPGGPLANEAGLSRGTGSEDDRFTGWHTMILPSGVEIADVPKGGSAVFAGRYGEVTIRHEGGSTYSYNYELTSRYQHDAEEDKDHIAVDADIIRFGITNGFDTGTAGIAIDIQDDRPSVAVRPGSGPGGPGSPALTGYEITGDWEGAFGADGEKSGGGRQLTFLDEEGNRQQVAFQVDIPTQVVINGTNYGSLEFKSDGSYVFKTIANQEGKVTVVMGYTDRDNDLVEGKITFDINRPANNLDPLGGRGEWFSEQNMPSGTAADSSQATKEILIPEDHTINTDMDGWEFLGFHEFWQGVRVEADIYLKSHPDPKAGNGYLTYFVNDDGQQRLTFTLEKNLSHKAQGIGRDDPAYATVGKVTLEDAVGNLFDVDTRFTVYDDQPNLFMTGRGNAQSGYEYKGTWSLVYGADGPSGNEKKLTIAVRVTFDEEGGSQTLTVRGPIAIGEAFAIESEGKFFGTLTLKDGAYSFVPAADLEADFTFYLTARDADGDAVTSEAFKLKVSPTNDPNLPDHLGNDDPVYEANLVDGPKAPHSGTNPDEEALTQEIEVPEGYTVSTDGWTEAGQNTWTLEGKYGYLTYVQDGERQNLSYTLTTAPQIPGAGHNTTQDSIDITLLDKGKNSVELPVVVEIADDVPLSFIGSNDNQSAVVVESGELFEDGKWFVNYGADGKAEGDNLLLTARMGAYEFNHAVVPGGEPVAVILNNKEYGTITFGGDGSYSFKAAANTTGQISFLLTGVDGDGDASPSPSGFTVTIQAADGPKIPHLGHDKVFSEANLDNGTVPDIGKLTQVLAVPDGFRIDEKADVWTYQPGEGNYIAKGQKGYLTWDGKELKYTLTAAILNDGTDPVAHTGEKGYDVIESIRLLNENGNEFYLNARLEIEDDAPQVYFGNDKTFHVYSGDVVTSATEEYKIMFGADGSSESADPLVVYASVGNAKSGPIPIPPGGFREIGFDGVVYGTLHLNDKGGFWFEANPNVVDAGQELRLKLSLVARDRDGDIGSTENNPATIVITKPAGPPSEYLGKGIEFNEAFLSEGTKAGQGELTRELPIDAGFTIDTEGWQKGSGKTFTLSSGSGVLTYNEATNKLSYTLKSSIMHGRPSTETDTSITDVFNGIKLKDGRGNIYELPAKITVLDDAPVLSVVAGGSESIGEDIFDFTSKGEVKVNFGADGDGGRDTIAVRVDYAFNREGGVTEGGKRAYVLPKDGSEVEFETAMGKGTIRFDSATNKIFYTYEALRGKKGESERLSFGAQDGDGDYGDRANVVLTLENNVPAAIFNVDEAGLDGIGSGAKGHGSSTVSDTVPAEEMPEQTTSITWDVSSIVVCNADGNDDGTYSGVTWQQVGNRLQGWAEGELVAEITPEFVNGVFTGAMSAQIYKAFDHSEAGDDIRLLLDLKFADASGTVKESTVALVIKDDEPFGNTGYDNANDKDKTFYAQESGGHREDVYLVIDVSGSIAADDMVKQIEALRFLVERYVESGVDVSLTLIPFAGDQQVRLEGVGPEEFLQKLTADLDGMRFLASGVSDGTNYTQALESAMKQILQGYSDPDRQFMDKKVFFLSDGAENALEGKFLDSWVPFYKEHPDLEIYALGVGDRFSNPSDPAMQALEDVTGNKNSVIAVDNFDKLAEILSGLVTPDLGNLLDGMRSADNTKLLSVYVDELKQHFEIAVDPNNPSAMASTGKIDLGDGITLIIYENGEYQLTTLNNVESDITYKISLKVKDADEDIYESRLMNFTIQDHLPQVYHKEANLVSGFSDTSVFGIFTADRSQWDIDGWVFSHMRRMAIDLPEGAQAFEYDSVLAPYSVRGCTILMTDRTMSPDNIKSFIGDKQSLQELLSDEGILPGGVIASEGASLHASMLSKEFSSQGGELVFNWSFSGRNYAGEEDLAFWFLLAEDGSVLQSGKLTEAMGQAPGTQNISGVQTVHIDPTDSTQNYKFVIGSADGGTANEVNSSLMLNTIVLIENHYDFAGNLLSDLSPDGKTDVLLDNAGITHVTYNDVPYDFNAEGVLTIDTGSGLFTLNKNGAYTFAAKDGNVFLVDEEITYHIKDQDEDEAKATITFKGGSRRAFTAMAEDEHGFDQARVLGGFEGNDESATLTGNGWYITHSSQFATGEALLPNALPVLGDASINPYLGEPYPWVRMHGKDNFTPRQCFTLFDTNDADEIQNLLLGAGLSADTFEQEPAPLAGAAMQKSFISKGGEIAFGWSFVDGTDTDAAFWILKDATGNIVDSGVIHQGGRDSGVLHVAVPHSAQAQEHVLVLGALKTGVQEDMEPVLYVSNVVLLEDEYHFKGNIIGSGENDTAYYENIRLESVTFGDETAHFDLLHQQHEFNTESGRLVIDWKGNYTFRANDYEESIEGERFSYRLRGEGDDKSGELVVRMTDPLVHDTLAEYHHDQSYQFAGNVFAQPSPSGELDDVSSGTHICRVEYAGRVYDMNDEDSLSIMTGAGGEFVINRDGSYFYSDGAGSDGLSAVEDFYYTVADARGHTDSAMLSIRGPQYQIGGNIAEDAAPQVSYGAHDYVGIDFGDAIAQPYIHDIPGTSGLSPLYLGLTQASDTEIRSDYDAVVPDTSPFDLFDEKGQFKWESQTGKDILSGDIVSDADKLHFSSLVEASENMESLLGKHLLNLNLDTESSTLTFEIADELYVKEVEIQLSPAADISYGNLVADYADAGSDSAQQEVLAQFLMSLSVH